MVTVSGHALPPLLGCCGAGPWLVRLALSCSAPSLLSLGDSLASAVPQCLILCSFSVFLSTLSYYAVLSDFPYVLSVSLLRFSGPFSLQVSS